MAAMAGERLLPGSASMSQESALQRPIDEKRQFHLLRYGTALRSQSAPGRLGKLHGRDGVTNARRAMTAGPLKKPNESNVFLYEKRGISNIEKVVSSIPKINNIKSLIKLELSLKNLSISEIS